MRIIKLLSLLLLPTFCTAQTFTEEINIHRQKYKADFLTDTNSPLKQNDTSLLRFFEPDSTFRVVANFKLAANAKPFEMLTSGIRTSKYVEYGELQFNLNGKNYLLHIYQNLALIKLDEYKDYLFLPFTDLTNGNETYGGGRYLDFKIGDIKNNKLVIDFNKAYNPYCAFSAGYSCPKPPTENKLLITIAAGEKNFSREHH
jgi:uncharacterized protein (DUF1684 family)